MAFKILIIGRGVAGIASAIAISKQFSTQVRIVIFEVREQAGDIGGAVNLTPNALRCLDILGVLDVLKTRKLDAKSTQFNCSRSIRPQFWARLITMEQGLDLEAIVDGE